MPRQSIARVDPAALAGSDFGAALPVGVFGARLARTRYGAALATLPAVRVTAILDADDQHARAWARDLGNRTALAADAADLLSHHIEGVLVASPLQQRGSHVEAALRAHLPALVEAPIAATLEEADRLISLARETGTVLLPALPRRLDPYIAALGAAMQSEAAGPVRQVRCAWTLPVETLEPEESSAGGWVDLLQSVLCQSADLCRLWLGAPLTLSADMDMEALAGLRPRRHARPHDDAVATLLVTHEKAQATHHVTRTRAVRPDERYIAHCDAGALELVVASSVEGQAADSPRLRLRRPSHRAADLSIDVPAPEAALRASTLRMRHLLLAFARAARGEAAVPFEPETAREAQELVMAAFVSSQEGARVRLPLRRFPDVAALLRARQEPRALPPP